MPIKKRGTPRKIGGTPESAGYTWDPTSGRYVRPWSGEIWPHPILDYEEQTPKRRGQRPVDRKVRPVPPRKGRGQRPADTTPRPVPVKPVPGYVEPTPKRSKTAVPRRPTPRVQGPGLPPPRHPYWRKRYSRGQRPVDTTVRPVPIKPILEYEEPQPLRRKKKK